MNRFGRLAAVVAVVDCLTPSPTLGGVADSPLPVLEAGKATLHVYTVPYAGRFGGVETIVACTSTEGTPMRVCVESFAGLGGAATNDCSANVVDVAPGQNVIFGTNTTLSLIVDSPSISISGSHGSARVLATSKKLVCTAFLLDAVSPQPTSMAKLTIISKTKQKGRVMPPGATLSASPTQRACPGGATHGFQEGESECTIEQFDGVW